MDQTLDVAQSSMTSLHTLEPTVFLKAVKIGMERVSNLTLPYFPVTLFTFHTKCRFGKVR